MFVSTLALNKMQLTGQYINLYFKILQFGNPLKYIYNLFVYWVLNKFNFIGFRIYTLMFDFIEFGTPVVISFCVLENRNNVK
jgi:ABC-type sulfate transport system permease subunit